jgi:hypothetical protein
MTRVIAYFARFLIIILGYALASLAASAFINVVFLGSQGFTAEESVMMAAGALVFSIPVVALVVAYFAFIPAVAVILIAEVLSRRDWLTYALAGGSIGLAVALFVRQAAESGNDAVRNPRALAAVVAAGIVGGIVYWMTAGRWAGGWSGPERPTSPVR